MPPSLLGWYIIVIFVAIKYHIRHMEIVQCTISLCLVYNLHVGVNYTCGQYYYQATLEGHLVGHRKTEHKGVRQCDHQTTSKLYLTQHKRAIHEGVK